MVAAPLYRSLLKKASHVSKHYPSLDDSLRAVFGPLFPVDYRCCTPALPRKTFKTPPRRSVAKSGADAAAAAPQEENIRQLVRWFFTGVPCPKSEQNDRIRAGFDVLLKCDLAVPNPEEDNGTKYFVGRATLTHLPNHFPSVIRNVKPRTLVVRDGKGMPLARHGFPSEPFYVMNSSETHKASFLRHFIAANLRDATVISSDPVSATVPASAFVSKKTAIERETDLQEALGQFSATTVTRNEEHGFEVTCQTEYAGLENETMNEPRYLFKYTMTLRNCNPANPDGTPGKTFMLLSRHWNFVDGSAKTVEEFVGPGVVGEFPLIGPEQSHVYSSGTSMVGPFGAMCGTYQLLIFPNGMPQSMQSTFGKDKINQPAAKKQHEQNVVDLQAEQVDVRVGVTALRAK